jgi:hypothetical protein
MAIAATVAITIAATGIGTGAAENTDVIEALRGEWRKERPRLAHCEAG